MLPNQGEGTCALSGSSSDLKDAQAQAGRAAMTAARRERLARVNVGEALSKIGGIVLYSSRGCLVTRRGSYVRLMRIVTPKQGDAPPLAEVVFLKDGHRMLTYLTSLDDEEDE